MLGSGLLVEMHSVLFVSVRSLAVLLLFPSSLLCFCAPGVHGGGVAWGRATLE